MGIDGTLDGTIGDGSRVDSGKGGNGLLIRDVLSRMYILTESPILWTLIELHRRKQRRSRLAWEVSGTNIKEYSNAFHSRLPSLSLYI